MITFVAGRDRRTPWKLADVSKAIESEKLARIGKQSAENRPIINQNSFKIMENGAKWVQESMQNRGKIKVGSSMRF